MHRLEKFRAKLQKPCNKPHDPKPIETLTSPKDQGLSEVEEGGNRTKLVLVLGKKVGFEVTEVLPSDNA